MILTPHAIIGAAVSSALPGYPILGFLLALASHYIVDYIPHNHYVHDNFIIKKISSVASLVNNIKATYQLSIIILDLFLGAFLAVLIFSRDWYTFLVALLGILGGILPDVLRFFYFKYKKDPFAILTKFHSLFDSKKNLDHKPLIGAIVQTVITLAFVLISFYIKS